MCSSCSQRTTRGRFFASGTGARSHAHPGVFRGADIKLIACLFREQGPPPPGTSGVSEPCRAHRETRCHSSPEVPAKDRKLRTCNPPRGVGESEGFQAFRPRSRVSTARLTIVVSPVRVRVSPSRRRPCNPDRSCFPEARTGGIGLREDWQVHHATDGPGSRPCSPWQEWAVTDLCLSLHGCACATTHTLDCGPACARRR